MKREFRHSGPPSANTVVTVPDPRVPLRNTLCDLARDIQQPEAESVNDPVIMAAVRTAAPDLVVYCGYGGQLVSAGLLNLGPTFLHVHSGWLPNYRSSTTVYCSLLAGDGCGVSAMRSRTSAS